jgi:serine/threonine protein kinase
MESSADFRPFGDDDNPHRDHSHDETMPLGSPSQYPSQLGRSPKSSARRDGIEKEGDEVGHYKLLTPLGTGGFGTVWLAKRMCDFEQMVAIKVVKPGMDSTSVLERFGQEMQLLALMDHPHVAKVLDAGTTPSGRPFFVMERVDGKPLTRYADEHRLTIEERLRLFLQVCEAIQYAHHKEIVHRDLKPSNILVVSDGNGGANSKVIDFGIAQALTRRMSEHTVNAESGQMVGTPEYMSPEQAEGSGEHVDGRSDVFSLGVILYELLVGVTPFDAKRLRSNGHSEIQRIIRQDEPPSPSVRFCAIHSEAAESARRIAQLRRASMSRLAGVIKGELGWIPMKAMCKEREGRYATPEALAEDVRNYLAGAAVSAVPPSHIYRLRKYARSHRGLLAMGSCLTVALLSFAMQAFLNKGTAMAYGEDSEWILNQTAANLALRPSSLEDSLRLQDEKIGELVQRQNHLRTANAEDELLLKRDTPNENTALDSRKLAIGARRNEIEKLERQLISAHARRAWFCFRLKRSDEAVHSQSLAVQLLDRILPKSRDCTPQERKSRECHEDALEGYRSHDTVDQISLRWGAGTPWVELNPLR